MKRFLITASALLALQVHSCLLAQNKNKIFNPELKIIVENGYLNLFIQLNEIFKWENTKFESIKKFCPKLFFALGIDSFFTHCLGYFYGSKQT